MCTEIKLYSPTIILGSVEINYLEFRQRRIFFGFDTERNEI